MSDEANNPPGSPPRSLTNAVYRVLRPLVRLLLNYQITYPQLAAMLKSVYVEVAEEEMAVPGKRQSDSRINLLTGIHRKDVKRLRAEPKQESTIPTTVSTGAQLIAQWMGDSQFQDDTGNPRALSYKTESSTTDTASEFEELVARVVRQDIRPRVIMDEWLRLGVAHLDGDKIVLNTGAFTPEDGFEEKAFFFGKNIQDHIAAGTHNLLGQKPSYFDRSVYYDGLTESSVNKLRALAEELGMQALGEMNRQALRLQQEDQSANDNQQRINFGIFNFHTLDNKTNEGN